MVVFDLDDTLVPVNLQLAKATIAAKVFMDEHMPKTSALIDVNLRKEMSA